jgi:hypothetical protein
LAAFAASSAAACADGLVGNLADDLSESPTPSQKIPASHALKTLVIAHCAQSFFLAWQTRSFLRNLVPAQQTDILCESGKSHS